MANAEKILDGMGILGFAVKNPDVQTFNELARQYCQTLEYKLVFCEETNSGTNPAQPIILSRITEAVNHFKDYSPEQMKRYAEEIYKNEEIRISEYLSFQQFFCELFRQRQAKYNVERQEFLAKKKVYLAALEKNEVANEIYKTFDPELQNNVISYCKNENDLIDNILRIEKERKEYSKFKPGKKKKYILEWLKRSKATEFDYLAKFLGISVNEIWEVINSDKGTKRKVDALIKKNNLANCRTPASTEHFTSGSSTGKKKSPKVVPATKVQLVNSEQEELPNNEQDNPECVTTSAEIPQKAADDSVVATNVETTEETATDVKIPENTCAECDDFSQQPNMEMQEESPTNEQINSENVTASGKVPQKAADDSVVATNVETTEETATDVKIPENTCAECDDFSQQPNMKMQEESPKNEQINSEIVTASGEVPQEAADDSAAFNVEIPESTAKENEEYISGSFNPSTYGDLEPQNTVRSRYLKVNGAHSLVATEWRCYIEAAYDPSRLFIDTNILMKPDFAKILASCFNALCVSTISVHELRKLLDNGTDEQKEQARQAFLMIANGRVGNCDNSVKLLKDERPSQDCYDYDLQLVRRASEMQMTFASLDAGAIVYARTMGGPWRFLKISRPETLNFEGNNTYVLDTNVFDNEMLSYLKKECKNVVITSAYAIFLNERKHSPKCEDKVREFQIAIATDKTESFLIYRNQNHDTKSTRILYEDELCALCKKNGFTFITSRIETYVWFISHGAKAKLWYHK